MERTINCCICEEKSKYKCPICRIPYCSVVCYKTHKSTPCEPPPAPQPAPTTTEVNVMYNYPTEDTVPLEKLKLLEHSPRVRECVKNQHLRQMMETLDKCEHPDTTIKKYMQETIFMELVDACLEAVGDDKYLEDL